MKLTITNDEVTGKTNFKPGQEGFFVTEDNLLVVIGEDDSHLWVILKKGGVYYGVFKVPENLSAIYITNDIMPQEPLKVM